MPRYNNNTIKNWAVEDRPREKLLQRGTESLSDAELIAILISSGTKDVTAVELARDILSSAGNNLHELGKLSIRELINFKGIGKVKALHILSALELGRRRNRTDATARQKITSSKDAFQCFQSLLSDLPHEEFWVLILNRSNQVIDKVRISQGGISGTVIDTRLILRSAIEKLASGLILCHNHPSGNLQPSEADKKITEKIKTAANYMEINLLDHLIIADKNYFSFADEGLI
jgi:DNA repair protein RadC